MIESPTSTNIGDFKQRYQGVLGWYIPEEGKSKLLVRVTSVNNERVTFSDKNGGSYHAYVDAGVRFEFLPIVKEWKNTPKSCYFLSRVPARQYKRGICEDNTSIISFNMTTGKYTEEQEYKGWYEYIYGIYSYNRTIKEDLKDFLDGKRECTALSKHFAIGNGHVLLYNTIIGSYSGTNITLKTDLFLQELTDLCNRNNYPFKVTV